MKHALEKKGLLPAVVIVRNARVVCLPMEFNDGNEYAVTAN